MSKKIIVILTDDHLLKLGVTKPLAALEELIWNAVDADATKIEIYFEKNELDVVKKIIVDDRGHGIEYETIKSTFGKVGDSLKKKRYSPKGRLYHGKHNFGRYKAYSLGNKIRWQSTIRDGGVYKTFDILGNNTEPGVYYISDLNESTLKQKGTKVTIEEIKDESKFLNSKKAKKEILKKFASYILANSPLNIYFAGKLLDPNEIIDKQKEKLIEVTTDNVTINAIVQIIKWLEPTKSEIFWCSDSGVCYKVNEVKGHKGTNLSCYVKSEFLEKAYEENKIDIVDMDPIFGELKAEVDKVITDYIREEISRNIGETIKEIRKQDIYPYKGKPQNIVEEYERDVFDICASHIYEYLPEFSESPKQQQKLTLKLVKEAIEQNPKSVKVILTEVLNLSEKEQDEFAKILEEIKLTSMINLSRLVTDRISTLRSLENILFNPKGSKIIKERSQLHKILENESWIFGEDWTLSTSDKKLKIVLESHLDILGVSSLGEDFRSDGVGGLEDIPDLFLYKTAGGHHQDEFNHLVVELKRPDHAINNKEIDQIDRYARTIIETPNFDKKKTTWTFILVNTKISPSAQVRITQTDRPKGLYQNYEGGNVKVWVKSWSEIFQPQWGRLKYLKQEIEFVKKDNKDSQYIKNKYPNLFPQ